MTDTKTPDRTKPAVDITIATEPEPKPRLLDFSATQIAGGALAAMTAAVIGAQLGVAGTVLGAAVGSIVAGIAGSLYTASLKHTKDKIAAVIVGKVGGTEVEITRVSDPRTDVPVWDTVAPDAALAPASGQPVATAAEVDVRGRRAARFPWKTVGLSTAAVFFLALAGITTFELVSGQAISGGQGTTITQVSEGRSSGTQTPNETPSTDTSADPTPSSQPSDSTSTEPSTDPDGEPTTDPSQTTEPSSSPSETSEPSTGTDPSTSQAPSTGEGDVEGQGADGDGAGG